MHTTNYLTRLIGVLQVASMIPNAMARFEYFINVYEPHSGCKHKQFPSVSVPQSTNGALQFHDLKDLGHPQPTMDIEITWLLGEFAAPGESTFCCSDTNIFSCIFVESGTKCITVTDCNYFAWTT